jgi:hypothetical protein
VTLAQLNNRIENALQFLESTEVERRAAVAGADLVALITSRVVQKGQTADGGSFSPYSTTPVPAWFYLGKSRTGSAEGRVKESAKKKEPISYKQFREINNLKTDKKNFEFTGTMWRGFGVVRVGRIGGNVRIVVGGKNDDSREKIEWLSDQENRDIIEPSPDEIGMVKKAIETWLINILNGRV